MNRMQLRAVQLIGFFLAPPFVVLLAIEATRSAEHVWCNGLAAAALSLFTIATVNVSIKRCGARGVAQKARHVFMFCCFIAMVSVAVSGMIGIVVELLNVDVTIACVMNLFGAVVGATVAAIMTHDWFKRLKDPKFRSYSYGTVGQDASHGWRTR